MLKMDRRAWGLALVFAVGSTPAWAEGEPLVEKLDHGQIDWSARTVLVTGSGAPNLKLKNVAQVRLAAERAAQVDAQRRVLEALGGVRVTATTTGKGALAAPKVQAQVQGMLRGCKTVDTRYYADGGVDVVLRCPLDGGLATAIAPAPKHKATDKAAAAKGDAQYSGLVIDAAGTSAKPALAPRILDDAGKEVYAATMVKPRSLRSRGVAAYAATVEAAKQDKRVGDKPLIIKASGLGEGDSEIKISAEDAQKLAATNQAFMADARVVIVTDAP